MNKTKKPSKFFQAQDKGKKVKLDDEFVMQDNPQPVEKSSTEEVAALIASATDAKPQQAPVATAPEKSPVSKKAATVQAEEAPKVTSNFKALGVYWDEKAKVFMRATVDYNPISGYSKVVKLEKIADSPTTAIYKINNDFSLKILKREEKI